MIEQALRQCYARRHFQFRSPRNFAERAHKARSGCTAQGHPPDCRAPKNTIFGRSPDERAPSRSRPPCTGGGHPRRQVDPGSRPRLYERHAGPDPTGDAAAAARPVGRPEYRRVHQRLPRLAARRRRPDRLEGGQAPRAPPREVPARAERRPRRHQCLGHAAGQHVRRREVRRRLCHVVRQGPWRGSLRRRVQARECGRHQPARRRAGAGRRRSWSQVVDAPAPVGPHLQGLHDAGALSGHACRSTSTWACTASQ